ncbi:hypothetical protein PV377_21215 [Streptomyces ipomoeae]|uniref:hypothetical protein n=1 Tax=Streptomyces ipomoeae TaxID=103232 RepID=UPI0029B2428B|nr:hypothetical protein [Streptomyces ipomoeae]MDX2841461.1 hypothetical protein [Streptomyces ipomoeae]
MSVPQIYTVIVLAVLGAAVCAIQWRRAVHASREEARARVGLPPAAPDNQPGDNLFDLDTCRRILRATDELEAGYARLWDAIHEHRKEDNR